MKKLVIRHSSLVTAALVAAAAATTAAARTVYDGGKALRQNCTSGTYANPYTDENGGKWSYHSSSAVAPFTNLGNFQTHTKIDSNQLDGWGGTASPHLKVNITGSALTRSGFLDNADPIEPDELVIHPAGSGNTYTVLRFTIPEDGWYSAFVSFRDTSLQPASNNPGVNSGASVYVTLGPSNGDKTLVSGIVSLEHVTNSTPRLDFQVPVQWLTAGMRFNFAVGNNVHDSAQANPHSNDATGVKVVIVKEDEGSFFDVGRALKNDVSSSSFQNPYGNMQLGAWHYLRPTVPAGVDFASWAPTNISYAMDGFTYQCKRNEGVGFCNNSENKSPFVVVNTNSTSVSINSNTAQLAPQEVCVHPNPTTGWTTVRFRPPVSGWYSGSIVARDVNRNPDRDGVRVYLNIADQVVDSAYIDYNDQSNSTAHITFDARLLAAGEPVDIVVSPTATIDSDATAISAIFRREAGDVYDAATSFTAQWAGGNTAHPFPDVLGGGATWDVGAKTNAQVTSQFYSMPANLLLNGTSLSWCVYAAGTSQANGNLPRIALATNGVVSSDSYYLMTGNDSWSKMLRIVPNEMFVHPNTPGYRSSSPTLKAKVPADGIYRMRGHARDLNKEASTSNDNADGVLFSLSAGGCIPAAANVSLDKVRYTGSVAEASVDGDRLWLKEGDTVDAVIDPVANQSNDATGLSVCYIKEGNVDANTRVVNVHITQRGSGKFSPTSQRPREGWATWSTWNALRPGDTASATCENCYEGDRSTRRNVTVSVTRDSGSAIAYGASTDANIYSYALSSDANDTYTFTIGELKKNEPYSLYLYSAKNASGSGNATFTVGGAMKELDESWIIAGGTKVLTRFYVTSDANGEITGTFAAKDANGGAFNGLTIVGAFPDYKESAFVITVR